MGYSFFHTTMVARTGLNIMLYINNLSLLFLYAGTAESRLAHCSRPRLIVLNPVLVSPFISRGAPRQTERPLLAKGGIMGE
jgi:hypothetical protein